MWARTVEVMLGCWLAMSPFIFGHTADQVVRWATDFSCALAVIVLSLLSFWKPLRHIHLAIWIPALWLIGFGWFSGEARPGAPALQNDIVTGLLLLMMAIIPTDAVEPSRAWQQWNDRISDS